MANPVLAAPEHKLNISLAYHHDRFRIGTNIQYIHGLYTQISNQQSAISNQQNFCLWSAHAAGRLWRELWLTLTADNILGTEYEINAGFPMPRTTVMAGLQFAF